MVFNSHVQKGGTLCLRAGQSKCRGVFALAVCAVLAMLACTMLAPQQAHAAHENDDIILGDYFQSGSNYTNNIFASYNGTDMYRIASVYKDRGTGDHSYSNGHYPQMCPSIIYKDGMFWSLSSWSSGCPDNTKAYFCISYSKDLVHWTHPEGYGLLTGTRGVKLSKAPRYTYDGGKFDNVAADWFVSKNGSVYIVLAAGCYEPVSGHKGYSDAYIAKVTELSGSIGSQDGTSGYYWPQNLRFKVQNDTAQWININNQGNGTLGFGDGSLFQADGKDYLVIKRNGNQNQIYSTSNIDNSNGWTLVNDNVKVGYEGANIVQYNGSYRLYADRLVGYDADGIRGFSSTSLNKQNWGSSAVTFTESEENSTTIGARHGSTIVLKHGTAEWQVAKKLLDTKIVQAKESKLWKRLAGNTAIGTMKTIVNEGWSQSDWAIVATTNGYYDALSASGLAGLLDCPILMTASNKLSDATKALIQSKKVKNVIVVGGTSAVSANTFNQIKALDVGVERVAGNTAIGTANAIYERGKKVEGGWGGDAVVATAGGFQDALSIAPYAYAKKAPIFLARGNSKTPATLSDSTLSKLKAGGFTRTIITGGTAAVASSVDKQVTGAKRLGGNTAYGTSKLIANFCISEGMEASHMGVATGKSYYDALAGAALCGAKNSVIVLADDGRLSNIDKVVKPNKSKLQENCYVFGGEKAIHNKVWNEIVTASGE